MISIITANKARAKTEFAKSVCEYIANFNEQIEYRTSRGESSMRVEKDIQMNVGQWRMFIDLIEKAGYRIVQIHDTLIEVFW